MIFHFQLSNIGYVCDFSFPTFKYSIRLGFSLFQGSNSPKSHFLGSNANPYFSYNFDVGGERQRDGQSREETHRGGKERKREWSIGPVTGRPAARRHLSQGEENQGTEGRVKVSETLRSNFPLTLTRLRCPFIQSLSLSDLGINALAFASCVIRHPSCRHIRVRPVINPFTRSWKEMRENQPFGFE